jgi:hypothetical protein
MSADSDKFSIPQERAPCEHPRSLPASTCADRAREVQMDVARARM